MTFKTEAQALSPRALWLPGEVSGGTVTDESGNGHDATNNGGTASGSGGPGDGLTSYMAFDGTDDYLDLTTLSDFGTELRTATFGVWVRDPVGLGVIYGVFNDGNLTAVQVFLNTDDESTLTNGQMALYVRGEDGTARDTSATLSSPETALVDGSWHFLVFRYDLDAATPTISIRFDKTELTLTYGEQDRMINPPASFEYPLALSARNLRGTIDNFQEADVAGLVLFDTNLTDQEADDLYDASFEGTGANIPVGQASEVEAGQPIAPLISRDVTVGQTTEAETAQPITPALVRQVTVNPATEAETANPITPRIDREVAVGQATEAEAANPVTARISREVVIGQVTERELARTITPDVEGPILVDVGQATERELARPIVPFIEGLVIGDITCVVIQPTATCAILSPSATCEFRL